MKNKTLKLVSIIFVFIIVVTFVNKFSYGWFTSNEKQAPDDFYANEAAIDDEYDPGSTDFVERADTFLNKADPSIDTDDNKVKDASDSIYNLLSSVGMIISIIVGIILGMIYMMTSAVDKAKVKESLTPYLIGTVVIFGAFLIWKIFVNTFGSL